MGDKIKIDYEKMQVIASLIDLGPSAILIDNGQARLVELTNHGELTVKTHDGTIKNFAVTEKNQF